MFGLETVAIFALALDVDSHVAEQMYQVVDIQDVGDVLDDYFFGGQQGCADDL